MSHNQSNTNARTGPISNLLSGDSFGNAAASGCLLNSVVVKHMQQLPGLNVEMIVQSVLENRFDHIYAMYNLLVDKMHSKRLEQEKLEHHASLAFLR